MHKNMCFAYYADDKWIGWYGDSFGTVSKYPKIYTHSLGQIETVRKNFNYKLENIANPKEELGFMALIFSSKSLLLNKKVSLRIVECPFFDGPNPEYKSEEFEALREKRREALTLAGIYDLEPSVEKILALKKFDEEHPEFDYKIRSWIYPDYELVKEWALKEPTEFISIITHEP
jgi:hypothetical protein